MLTWDAGKLRTSHKRSRSPRAGLSISQLLSYDHEITNLTKNKMDLYSRVIWEYLMPFKTSITDIPINTGSKDSRNLKKSSYIAWHSRIYYIKRMSNQGSKLIRFTDFHLPSNTHDLQESNCSFGTNLQGYIEPTWWSARTGYKAMGVEAIFIAEDMHGLHSKRGES